MTKSEYIGTNEFKLTMPISKSYEKKGDDGATHLYVAGIASGTGLDLDGERMAKSAIDAFKKAIDEGIVTPQGKWGHVPLRSGHRKEWDDVLGWITKAEVDDQHNLWIEAELDDTSSVAKDLFAKLNRGDRPGKPVQLGFSVGGSIKKASREWDANVGRSIRIIEDVILKEISVVGQPAYPTAYVEALTKSVNWDEVPLTKEEATKELAMFENEKVTVDKAAHVEDKETEVTKTEADEQSGADDAASVDKSTEEVGTTTDPKDDNAAEKSVYYSESAEGFKDLLTKLQSQLDEIKALVGDSSKAVADTKDEAEVTKTETKVEKAEEKVETTSVEKSVEDRVADAVTAALNAFKTEHIDPITKAVEEIAAQPVDKSLSVRTAKEAESALEKFHSKVSSTKNPSIIGEAVRLAVRGDE